MKSLLSKITENIGDAIANINNKNTLLNEEASSFKFKLSKYTGINVNFSKFMEDLKSIDEKLYEELSSYIDENKSKFNESVIKSPVKKERKPSSSSSTRSSSTRWGGYGGWNSSGCGSSRSSRSSRSSC